MNRFAVLRRLVSRSLRQHALASLVTGFAIALASGLTLSVYAIDTAARLAFTERATDYDAVVGERGHPLQLVLNSVFHLDTSPGNIPWSVYEGLRRDARVVAAVPYAVGDNYRNFRIVGTTLDAFPAAELGPQGRLVGGRGRVFDPACREVVLGSFAAERTGLVPGAKIHPSHDVDGGHEHDDEYLVVGVRAPTGTPADRVVWIPIEGVFRMEGHALTGTGTTYRAREGEPVPDAVKEVSAVLLRLRSPTEGMFLKTELEARDAGVTVAFPVAKIVGDLFDRLGWASRVLTLVAHLVCVVAAAAVLAGLYGTIEGRRREFAILRALGAPRSTVFASVVAEAAVVAALGCAAGFVVRTVVLAAAAAVLRARTGVVVDVYAFGPEAIAVPVAVTCLGALAGLVPAWKAFRTDVAANLAPTT